MSIVRIKCPVCFDVLELSEWSKYVGRDVSEIYEKNSRPFKELTRHCPHCGKEVVLVKKYEGDKMAEYENVFLSVQSTFASLISDDPEHEKTLDEFKNMVKHHMEGVTHLGTPPTIADIRLFVLSKMKPITIHLNVPMTRSVTKKRRLRDSSSCDSVVLENSKWCEISALLISLETDSQRWRDLLFSQLQKFPQQRCSYCDVYFCFQCGEEGYHLDYSCLEWMQYLVNLANDAIDFEILDGISGKERIANLKWKIANSKSCPRCYTLINREEGCNKVDCTMCGHRFCWMCLSSWSEKCGFYRCKLDPVTPLSPNEGNQAPVNAKVEIGVPDVVNMHLRINLPVSPTAGV